MNSGRPCRSSIILLADGLRPSSLGPYGNTWFDTHFVNRLASESLLFEQCISDSPDIQLGIRGILGGQHSCDRQTRPLQLLQRLAETDFQSHLITSDRNRISDIETQFDRVIEIPSPENEILARDLTDTSLANFFAAVIQQLREMTEPALLLLDCPAFSAPWDAPYPYRKNLADEEDPTPSDFVHPPSLQFNLATDDPDQLLDYQTAYNAQAMLFDQMVGLLLDETKTSHSFKDALFCLTATRAFPLGEHGVVGYYRPVLYNELLKVPALVHYPQPQKLFGRSQQLVQPGSLFDLLCNWHLGADDQMASAFPVIDKDYWLQQKKSSAVVSKITLDELEFCAIQTYAWKYISGPAGKLFVKPDDIWEYNDASELCPEVFQALHQELTRSLVSLGDGLRPEFDLPDALAFGVE